MITELEDRGERRPGFIVFGDLRMRLNSQHVSTQEGTENDLTYMTLGRIIDMRVDAALKDILSFCQTGYKTSQPVLP